VLAVAAVLALTVGRSQAQRRRVSRAEDIRDEAAEQARDIERRESEVEAREAAAQRARAEAEQRAAEAERIEADVNEQRAALDVERAEVENRLAAADRIDPPRQRSERG
jgi:hypothetical protein